MISSRIAIESITASLRSIPHFGSLPRPSQLLTPRVGIQASSSTRSNADMEPQSYQSYSSRIFSEEVSSMSNNMRPRSGNLPRSPQRFKLHVGSQVFPSANSIPGMKCLCPQCSPSQIIHGETPLISNYTSDPTQLNSYRQISYAAPDNQTPSLSGILGASQVTDTDPKNKIGTTSIFVDTLAQQAKNITTKQKVTKNGLKKEPNIAATPTEHDVLAGRGGQTNKHSGNLVFREEARKLRVYYRMKDTSRDDKFAISVVRCCSRMNNFDPYKTLGFHPHRDCFYLLRTSWKVSRKRAAGSWVNVPKGYGM